MAYGVTFEISNIILLNSLPLLGHLQNFREIGLKLTDKLPKIMRS